MKTAAILAFDASTDSCSVALQYAGHTFSRTSVEPRRHAQTLLPMVDELLTEAQIDLSHLDYLALTNGPGSFTGIRIALSVVQGLSYAANIPVICMSSLDVLAVNGWAISTASPTIVDGSPITGDIVVSALDARMGEVYWGAYRTTEASHAKLRPYAVSSYDDFNREFGDIASAGDSVVGYGSAWSIKALVADGARAVHANVSPSADCLLRLLDQHHAIDSLAQEAALIEPLYLRNEVAWQKRTRIRTHSIIAE